MKYKVKTRYRTLHEGDDPIKARQIYQAYKDGGMTNVKMTPNLVSHGFVKDFDVKNNALVFKGDNTAFLVNEHLKSSNAPIELVGNKIVVLNEKFLSKIVYLTDELLKDSSKLSSLAKNKLGITNDVKKYLVNLDGGNSFEIFAFSSHDAREQAKKLTDRKIKNIKQL